MKHSLKTGFSFGLTSGVITTLGLLVGLNSGTHSRLAVIGGILTIAVVDAFSDALGIHVSEESEIKHSHKEIWVSTLSTFSFKFIVSMTFILPVLFLPLNKAVIVSVIWGMFLLSAFSVILANQQKKKIFIVAGEHILVAGIVILLTHYLGLWINRTF
jgi:vacuolar iron transporter family protein